MLLYPALSFFAFLRGLRVSTDRTRCVLPFASLRDVEPPWWIFKRSYRSAYSGHSQMRSVWGSEPTVKTWLPTSRKGQRR